jgi:hypothetical protein
VGAKRIRGTLHYFGPSCEPEGALEPWAMILAWLHGKAVVDLAERGNGVGMDSALLSPRVPALNSVGG